jgi:hypothetical protein
MKLLQLCSLLFILLTGCNKNISISQEGLYEEVLGVAPSPTVTILKINYDTNFKWGHCKITSADFKQIISKFNYNLASNPKLDYSKMNAPGWWGPEKLGEGYVCYDKGPDLNIDDYWGISIFVNSSKTEIYYVANKY